MTGRKKWISYTRWRKPLVCCHHRRLCLWWQQRVSCIVRDCISHQTAWFFLLQYMGYLLLSSRQLKQTPLAVWRFIAGVEPPGKKKKTRANFRPKRPLLPWPVQVPPPRLIHWHCHRGNSVRGGDTMIQVLQEHGWSLRRGSCFVVCVMLTQRIWIGSWFMISKHHRDCASVSRVSAPPVYPFSKGPHKTVWCYC